MEDNKFAIRLKELRENRKISQTKLANVLGYTQTAIAKWETGVNEPKINDILAIAKIFGVSTDYLLGLTDFS